VIAIDLFIEGLGIERFDRTGDPGDDERARRADVIVFMGFALVIWAREGSQPTRLRDPPAGGHRVLPQAG
jgi:hypothetical protein